jgi:hypothetical protein
MNIELLEFEDSKENSKEPLSALGDEDGRSSEKLLA